ncbi:hypothetical protein BD311DRAFT_165469 [Dichomitus squalens]|uniref:Uncharacterized protein n=1 Tax=Dichomitus squalens TaxID=114155 RepID=A0A4V2JYS7_9APHY|nr:hypothetical protein BD311DRAFT_165469 [Dichomitus squalens]
MGKAKSLVEPVKLICSNAGSKRVQASAPDRTCQSWPASHDTKAIWQSYRSTELQPLPVSSVPLNLYTICPSLLNPLHGILPRKATAEQVIRAMESDVNPFNKQPHKPQYKRLLERRKKLPVFDQMSEFLKMVRSLLCLRTTPKNGTRFAMLPSPRSKNVAHLPTTVYAKSDSRCSRRDWLRKDV